LDGTRLASASFMSTRRFGGNRLAVSRLLLAGGCVGLLSACPKKAEPCREPVRQVDLAGPDANLSLGTFRGPLTWLQTGEQTELVVRTTPRESVVELSCASGSVQLDTQIDSADGLLSFDLLQNADVNGDGVVTFAGVSVAADALALAEAGKLPDASNIAERQPSATVGFAQRDDGTWAASVTVSTSTDYFHAAVGTLERDPS
jgi:hypothetical protein